MRTGSSCGFLVACMLVTAAHGGSVHLAVWNYEMAGERQFYERLCDGFARENPGAGATFEMGVWDDAHAKIAKWIEDGAGPDLVVVPDIWIAEFADGIRAYESYVTEEFKARFYPVLYDKSLYRGRLYGPVWATSTKALFYRTDLFQKAGLRPPRTLDELVVCARRLNDPPGHYGIGLPGAPEYDTADQFYFFFWGFGGEFFDASGKSAINGPAGLKALSLYCDLPIRYRATQPEIWRYNRNETQRLFERGQLAMFETGPWAIEALRKNAPGLPFGVVPLPTNAKPFTQIITDHLVIMKYSARPDLCHRFIEYAYHPSRRWAFCALGMVPELMAVGASRHFQADPAWKVFVDIIPTGKALPMMKWEPVEMAMREALSDALRGKRTYQQALGDVARAMDRAREESRALAP